jgi:hypothetical protein
VLPDGGELRFNFSEVIIVMSVKGYPAMPALDKCEPQILNAFRKDGWQVIAKPFVTMVDFPERKRPARVVVQARIEGDRVIVEEDTTDRPL